MPCGDHTVGSMHKGAHTQETTMETGPELIEPEEHVLSTLEADGSRRWLSPRLSKGRFWRRRRVVAYVLLALYSFLPWIQIGGEQALRFDLPARRFTFFGATFLPSDTLLLALLLLLIFLGIFAATALFGRLWCGWACPQTVYMEFVFRPLERLFLGRTGKGGPPTGPVAPWRRVAMYATYLVICVHLAQTFVAYFAGTANVKHWIWGSPLEHLAPFIVVVAVTVLMMIDFAFWREQLCIIGCPYGRFQSVLLDRWSKIVAYDERRGEPRGKRKQGEKTVGKGDCVDCKMCVVVCPTGIDIRKGLQLECVNCTQCMDACDDVMDKIGAPRGLIRYSSQAADAGEPSRFLRPRPVVYFSLIAVIGAAFLWTLTHRPDADLTVLRGRGHPFAIAADGVVENTFRIKLTNRTDDEREFELTLREPVGASVRWIEGELELDPGETATEAALVRVPRELFKGEPLAAVLVVTDDLGEVLTKEITLLGPNPAPVLPAGHDSTPVQPAGDDR